MLKISYWLVPIVSSLVWLAMLIAMLTTWAAQGKRRYASMDPTQNIPYISDIGASGLKPLFISMSAVAVVTFDLAFIFERYLRHAGKLAPNTSVWQKVESVLATITAIVGAAGLILLSIFDTLRHPRLHDAFLAVFILGYVLSAVFICWEYQRLGIHFREHSVLRYSFWIKLSFILVEVGLAIGFGVCTKTKRYNPAAILEWTVAFIFFFYVLSFALDFLPVVRGGGVQSRETEMEAARDEGDYSHGNGHGHGYNGNGNGYTNGHANGYTNGHGNGYNGNAYTNGHSKREPPVRPARNF